MSSSPSSPTSTLHSPFLAPVVATREVASRHFLLTLEAPLIAKTVRAGQFVHILPRDSADTDPLLRRAFSVMALDGDAIKILFRVEGRGTARLAAKRVGDTIDVLGPLGKPFDSSPLNDTSVFHVKQSVILIGGGVGVPPIVFLASQLQGEKSALEVTALVGARSRSEVLGEADFASIGVPMQIATDDGTQGHHGRVTELLESALLDDANAVIYACGPWPMLRTVAAVAAKYGAHAQVSLEENMPCGIGVCNGCVVAMRETEGGTHYDRYRRICIEGPAVWSSEIDWEVR